jgi:hypothetical protein
MTNRLTEIRARLENGRYHVPPGHDGTVLTQHEIDIGFLLRVVDEVTMIDFTVTELALARAEREVGK